MSQISDFPARAGWVKITSRQRACPFLPWVPRLPSRRHGCSYERAHEGGGGKEEMEGGASGQHGISILISREDNQGPYNFVDWS